MSVNASIFSGNLISIFRHTSSDVFLLCPITILFYALLTRTRQLLYVALGSEAQRTGEPICKGSSVVVATFKLVLAYPPVLVA